MRKLLSLLMIAGMVSLFACGTCEKEEADADVTEDQQEVMQAEEETAPDTMTMTEEEPVEPEVDTTAQVEE